MVLRNDIFDNLPELVSMGEINRVIADLTRKMGKSGVCVICWETMKEKALKDPQLFYKRPQCDSDECID